LRVALTLIPTPLYLYCRFAYRKDLEKVDDRSGSRLL